MVSPDHAVHLTGAQLVDVPDSFTVIGIYAISMKQLDKPVLDGADQQYWDQMGYSAAHLYPVTDVDLPAGGTGGWWLVAKVIPHKTGKQTIPGVRVSYSSGLRSGSAFLGQSAITDCPR